MTEKNHTLLFQIAATVDQCSLLAKIQVRKRMMLTIILFLPFVLIFAEWGKNAVFVLAIMQ